MELASLFYINASVAGIQAVVLLIAWRLYPHLPGVREYTMGTVLVFAGMLLHGVLRPEQMRFGPIAGNFVTLYGLVLLFSGVRRFLDMPVPGIGVALVPIIAVTVATGIATASGGDAGRYWRVVLVSGCVALLAIVIVADLLRAQQAGSRVPRVFLAFMFGLLATASAVRAGWMVLEPATQLAGYPSPYEKFFLVLLIIIYSAITLGICLMVAAHLIDRLNAQASVDALTGTLNRRAFEVAARPVLARAARAGVASSLMVMDLDRFKAVNDAHGHAVGDRVLAEFAAVARDCLRAQDVLARFGGEEFVALLAESDSDHARDVAERLRRTWAEREIRSEAVVVRVTASIGVSEIDPRESMNLESAYRNADRALYRAKEAGRNRVEVYAAGA